jgi:hypothetical protein
MCQARADGVPIGPEDSGATACRRPMASGIAQDFNNSLTPIVSYSELHLDSPDRLNPGRHRREHGRCGDAYRGKVACRTKAFMADATGVETPVIWRYG